MYRSSLRRRSLLCALLVAQILVGCQAFSEPRYQLAYRLPSDKLLLNEVTQWLRQLLEDQHFTLSRHTFVKSPYLYLETAYGVSPAAVEDGAADSIQTETEQIGSQRTHSLLMNSMQLGKPRVFHLVKSSDGCYLYDPQQTLYRRLQSQGCVLIK